MNQERLELVVTFAFTMVGEVVQKVGVVEDLSRDGVNTGPVDKVMGVGE